MAHVEQGETGKDVCVVLIHGIGEVASGSVIRSAEAGIRRSLRDEFEVVDRRVLDPVQDAESKAWAHIESLRLRWPNANIEILEFNWTGVTGKIRMRRPLQALWRLMETVREAPSLAVDAGSSFLARWTVALAGWYQWLLVGLTALLVVGSIVEVIAMPQVLTCDVKFLQSNTLHTDCRPREEVVTGGLKFNPFTAMILSGYHGALWRAGYYLSSGLYYAVMAAVLWSVVALFVAAPLFVLGLGRLLLPRRPRWLLLVIPRTLFVSALLALAVVFAALMVHAVATSSIAIGYVSVLADAFDAVASVVMALFCAIILLFIWVVLGIANLLRDVVHYLSSAPGAIRSRDGEALRRQLSLLLSGLIRRPKAPHLVLVSHSLGTVILVDLLLNGSRYFAAVPAASVDIVTAGSPISRLINRMLPHRLPEPAGLCALLRQDPALRVDRWFNVYRMFDYVGQSLTRSALPRELFVPRREKANPHTGIREHLLEPRFAWPLGHANYWRDERFVAHLAADVVWPLLVAAPAA